MSQENKQKKVKPIPPVSSCMVNVTSKLSQKIYGFRSGLIELYLVRYPGWSPARYPGRYPEHANHIQASGGR